MSTNVKLNGAKLIQTADVAGGEPPKYALELPKAITVATDGGAKVTSQKVEISNGEYYRSDFQGLVGKKVAVSLGHDLSLPAEAHKFPGFDFSPPSETIEVTVSPEDVKALTGKDVLAQPAVDPMGGGLAGGTFGGGNLIS